MKKHKFLGIAFLTSFILGSIGVNAWGTMGYAVSFDNWGPGDWYTNYYVKDTIADQSWETLEVVNGGNPEVVLQESDMGVISDYIRIYLENGEEYTWLNDLSKIAGSKYRLRFRKNSWTLGMSSVTGFWNKY